MNDLLNATYWFVLWDRLSTWLAGVWQWPLMAVIAFLGTLALGRPWDEALPGVLFLTAGLWGLSAWLHRRRTDMVYNAPDDWGEDDETLDLGQTSEDVAA